MFKARCSSPTCTNVAVTRRHQSLPKVAGPKSPPQATTSSSDGSKTEAPLAVIKRNTITHALARAHVTIGRWTVLAADASPAAGRSPAQRGQIGGESPERFQNHLPQFTHPAIRTSAAYAATRRVGSFIESDRRCATA